jgi:hypothetical protein
VSDLTRATVTTFLVLLLFTSCCIPPTHKTVTSSTGQTLCGKHKVPLITRRVYRPDPTKVLCMLPVDDLDRRFRCFPNALAFPLSTTPTPEFGGIPTKATYCPKCEEEINR